jgi:hypothetical protein
MPRCAAGARARGVISRRPLYVMRSIEASSLSMLSCDSILSEADLRSSALTVLSRTVVHEMPFPQKRSRHGSQRTASGLLELRDARVPCEVFRAENDPKPDRRLGSVVRHPACCFEWLGAQGTRPSSCESQPHTALFHPDLHSCRPPCLEQGSGARQQLHQRRPWSSPRTA